MVFHSSSPKKQAATSKDSRSGAADREREEVSDTGFQRHQLQRLSREKKESFHSPN